MLPRILALLKKDGDFYSLVFLVRAGDIRLNCHGNRNQVFATRLCSNNIYTLLTHVLRACIKSLISLQTFGSFCLIFLSLLPKGHDGKDGVQSMSLNCFFRFGSDLKQIPSFPLYGGMKLKTRSLSLNVCYDLAVIFKQIPSFPPYGAIKLKTRSLSFNVCYDLVAILNRLSVFSTL